MCYVQNVLVLLVKLCYLGILKNNKGTRYSIITNLNHYLSNKTDIAILSTATNVEQTTKKLQIVGNELNKCTKKLRIKLNIEKLTNIHFTNKINNQRICLLQ